MPSSPTVANGSSSTSSPTTTSSCTSEPGALHRLVGILRLGHPFPSLLNSVATLGFATLAGAPGIVAGRLALSMLGIQIAIGALNDHADRDRDAAEKPGKPIPAGLATARQAIVLAVVAGALGLALSAMSGLSTVLAIGFALAMGVTYDLRLSRTAWSWLPLALALPVVPIHAWLGSTGSVPPGLVGLVPTAVLAGAMLAIANGLVDVERDARSNRPSAVVALGVRRGWLVHAALLATVVALTLVLAPSVPSADGAGGGEAPVFTAVPIELLRALRAWGVAIGVGALAMGAGALRAASTAVRERGWELEAVGVAGVGLGWLAGTAAVAGEGL